MESRPCPECNIVKYPKEFKPENTGRCVTDCKLCQHKEGNHMEAKKLGMTYPSDVTCFTCKTAFYQEIAYLYDEQKFLGYIYTCTNCQPNPPTIP